MVTGGGACCLTTVQWSTTLSSAASFFLLFIADGAWKNLPQMIYLASLAVVSIIGLVVTTQPRQRTYLDVSPEGVTLHWRGAVLRAAWRDMQHIAPIKQAGYIGWEGITLRDPVWERPWWQPLIAGWSHPNFIPLWSWQPLWDRALGDSLRQSAPWVFTPAPQVPMRGPIPQPQWG